jgi:hypothetical protein
MFVGESALIPSEVAIGMIGHAKISITKSLEPLYSEDTTVTSDCGTDSLCPVRKLLEHHLPDVAELEASV